MNPFLLSPRERLMQWKLLRQSLSNLPEPVQLITVVNYWCQCPLRPTVIDPATPTSWPGPWEMLYRNEFDTNARAIGMEMTLRLAGWPSARLTLAMIDDSEPLLVLKIDDDIVLNYSHDAVCKAPCLPVLYAYQFNGRHYMRII